ncbi:MAG TPA: hypothetical protein VMV59_11135 [Candidatus Dormibacteraeota bacterium]|nr:hypothetical protein [Candidatus Dormibacteraeota bacterium]
MTTAAVTRIPNQGAMSDFVRPFEVASKMTDMVYRCRFSHCWNAIATRHADTIDCKFYVDGKGVILGLAHPVFIEFSGRAKRNLTDREASFIAAEYLRERLEQEDEHALYDVPHQDVIRVIDKLGIK